MQAIITRITTRTFEGTGKDKKYVGQERTYQINDEEVLTSKQTNMGKIRKELKKRGVLTANLRGTMIRKNLTTGKETSNSLERTLVIQNAPANQVWYNSFEHGQLMATVIKRTEKKVQIEYVVDGETKKSYVYPEKLTKKNEVYTEVAE